MKAAIAGGLLGSVNRRWFAVLQAGIGGIIQQQSQAAAAGLCPATQKVFQRLQGSVGPDIQ